MFFSFLFCLNVQLQLLLIKNKKKKTEKNIKLNAATTQKHNMANEVLT